MVFAIDIDLKPGLEFAVIDRGPSMHSAIRTQEVNPARMTGLFKKQFELCRVGPGQTVAVVSDLGTRREYIQAAFAAAEEMG
jgi:2,5-dihydroxypyridine 5,6-dioxygenase